MKAVVVVVVKLVVAVTNSLSADAKILGTNVVVDFLLFFLLRFLFFLLFFLRLFLFFFLRGLSEIFFLGLFGLFLRLGFDLATAVVASGLAGGTRSIE